MKSKLHLFFNFQQEIRNFFLRDDYKEVIVPPAVENPGMEPHLHPFALYSMEQKIRKNIFLHTSPEFKMKELLSYDFKKIFTLSYSFRDEPNSTDHHFQFLMLEWYQVEMSYIEMMNQTYHFITFLSKKFNPHLKLSNTQKSVKEIFNEILNVNLDNLLSKNDLINYMKNNFNNLLPKEYLALYWEDIFFILFLNKIEPELKKYPFLILKDYPAQLSALSELSEDKKYCKRFELYLFGLEIGNCFQELTNYDEQVKRFKVDKKTKINLYHYDLPTPNLFYKTLKRGLPRSSGIAIGVERLFKIICEQEEAFIF